MNDQNNFLKKDKDMKKYKDNFEHITYTGSASAGAQAAWKHAIEHYKSFKQFINKI